MRPFGWLRFAYRAAWPGVVWIALGLAAGCSGGGRAVAPTEAPPAKAAQAPPERPAENPLPLDAYASAMIPRWYLPSPPLDRPAFTPHWYTPSVDPLFRRHLLPDGTPEPRSEPHSESAADGPPGDAPAEAPPVADAPAPRRHVDDSLKDFDAMAPLLEGIASWYGPGFHGKPTASGEIYDQQRMTAAHPSLPLGTIIRVQNQSNGHVVWVRVNDRGPYAKGRVLDLSRAAAERLGMVDEGTAPVQISILRWPRSTDTELGLRAYSQYVVQVAAYPEPDKAEDVLVRMQGRFDWAEFMVDPRPNGLLSVVAGPYDDGGEAQRVARRLQKSGVTSLVRRWRK
jgi:rare lipoprotein A